MSTGYLFESHLESCLIFDKVKSLKPNLKEV